MDAETPRRTEIFADAADLDRIRELSADPSIGGFTTNPTLMRRAGVGDYRRFAAAVLDAAAARPVSFEVIADDIDEMELQARTIASWGRTVYVKIPITNTRGDRTTKLLRRLSADGVRVNVTAVLSLAQVREAAEALDGGADAIVSVFAGRVADTGRDPIPHMREALRIVSALPRVRLMWASARELLNLAQANSIGCPLITLPDGLLAKRPLLDRDLEELSLDTVRMFYDDACEAGYAL
ncbi:transaldolase [Nocardia takedensis]